MNDSFGVNIGWWIGVVEKRDDDFKIGRCRIRLFNRHTGDTAAIPTEQLPWAYPLMPNNDGLFSTPKEGETVFGIVLDKDQQNLIMFGRLPAKEQNFINTSEGDGYKDARSDDELVDAPRQKLKSLTFAVDGSGVTYEEFPQAFKNPWNIGNPTTPTLSIGDSVPTQFDPVKGTLHTTGITAKGISWVEPISPYAPQYPYNHAYESESGHVLEFDDTYGAERVRIMHRVGSGFEFHTSGDRVEKIVKDNYTVVLGSDRLQIYGDADITIDGDSTIYVKGDKNERIDGDYNIFVGGSMKKIIKKDYISNISGQSKHKADGDMAYKSGQTLYLVGDSIHENSSTDPDIETLTPFDLPTAPKEPLSVEAQKPLIDATGSTIATNDDATTSVGEPTPNNKIQPVSVGCPVIENGNFVDGDERYRVPVSSYFQVADVSIRAVYAHNIVAQNGLNEHDIVCNLSFLCKNVVDKLMEKFPGLRINSAFRTHQDGSQHEVGEAIDLQWPSIKVGSLNKYLNIANYVADNLPFDQIILEHGSTVWLHVSLKRNGTNRKQKLTMKDGTYTPGFSLKGRT